MSLQKNTRAVRRYANVMRFAAWLQGLIQRMTPAPFRLIQTGSAFWQSRALYAAAQLGIADVIGDGTLSAAEIANKISANADAVARLLRFLVTLGIFEEAGPHSYRNNKVSACLQREHPQSVRAMILMHNSETMSRPWYEQLESGVLNGTPPFVLQHGQALFDYLDNNSVFDRQFSEAMDSVEALAGDAFATDFDWGQFQRVIDLGGSRGSKSLAILQLHPHLEALVVDRPQTIAEAQDYWKSHSQPSIERMQFIAGDILQAVPASRDAKDVYLLSAVLHALDDEAAVMALRQVKGACQYTGARIAVLEMVLPETGASAAEASFDMQMFTGSHGRERTDSEWQKLFQQSGLVREELVKLRSFASIQVLTSC